MWRRLYFLLFLVRVYFALSPSYLHPDENFQGPEVVAGRVFSYPVHETWEFTSAHPIRSTFPLWLAYGWPMYILRWLWEGFGYDVSPSVVYWALRVLMLTLSVVMEDWAIHELVVSPRARRVAVPLVASSYVTWTFQTHTFSNSLETLLVLWSLVLIQRIVEDKKRSGILASSILGFMVVPATTFPAQASHPHHPGDSAHAANMDRPFSFVFLAPVALLTAFVAICIDTTFYTPGEFTFAKVFSSPVITPYNNFRYNSVSENLAQHGIHPRYQHFLVNLPQLLGPAFPLLFFLRRAHFTPVLVSALSGVTLLSIFPHQEARFLLPAVPLILSSIRLPGPRIRNAWMALWIVFNLALGILMGIYHQGGIIPVQMHIAKTNESVSHAFWWKTYSPPTWLLNGKNSNLTTIDLMGIPGPQMLQSVLTALPPCRSRKPPPLNRDAVYLVAPRSAHFLLPHVQPSRQKANLARRQKDLVLVPVWSYPRHVNLDDLDFAEDGLAQTVRRVVGDRGLVVWRAERNCWGDGGEGEGQGDGEE
ncbi:similar to alpha 1,2-mannosyltransferase Smp3 [Plenodomus lingam JN3]|uniref:Mannosyltransferase n=1 Tax=Leptosphaeria maculans (strain JN3 / isolate v23.1.3 / race Av1-4-5-6-7-8) TaxID=985895 RepID=E5ABR1_LEPMJ|nr:similar to alpha 1,2-mannosyltransferase Smp3 [Plenodomus lingam JN3]CBY01102.1 similar to alpha 1,2-mannosyltransferase Smp3 [Plenodomus lingam JN3]